MLTKKTEDFGEKIRSSQCTVDTVMYTYNASFLKSIKYSSIVTNFDSKKWNKIIAPALESSLNKSVMARKFPRGVLYGPNLYEGLNIKHTYYNQGITKLWPMYRNTLSLHNRILHSNINRRPYVGTGLPYDSRHP